MRTKQEVIEAYLGVENLQNVDMHEMQTFMGSEVMKDVMNAWAEEVLGSVSEQVTDEGALKVIKEARKAMYPLPSWDNNQPAGI